MPSWDDELRKRDAPPPPEVAPHRSRKNTRRWCRGKVGIEHVLDVPTLKSWIYAVYGERDDRLPCHWVNWGKKPYWICQHQVRCVLCGKIMTHYMVKTECPDYEARPDVDGRVNT